MLKSLPFETIQKLTFFFKSVFQEFIEIFKNQ